MVLKLRFYEPSLIATHCPRSEVWGATAGTAGARAPSGASYDAPLGAELKHRRCV
ncbi:MAG TPA: hypothetical protein PKV78_07575 [Methanoculleus thermophilus]|nr:hypothetical protein [Methanoculleus thermophilus]